MAFLTDGMVPGLTVGTTRGIAVGMIRGITDGILPGIIMDGMVGAILIIPAIGVQVVAMLTLDRPEQPIIRMEQAHCQVVVHRDSRDIEVVMTTVMAVITIETPLQAATVAILPIQVTTAAPLSEVSAKPLVRYLNPLRAPVHHHQWAADRLAVAVLADRLAVVGQAEAALAEDVQVVAASAEEDKNIVRIFTM